MKQGKIERSNAPKLLLVEDHADSANILVRLLNRAGYQVLVAPGATEALQIAEGERIDLLISDIRLPDGSGHDVMQEMHARHQTRGIALSGDDGAVDGSRFDAHLVKPVDFDLLVRTIQRILGMSSPVPE